jgi:hypothetical protein
MTDRAFQILSSRDAEFGRALEAAEAALRDARRNAQRCVGCDCTHDRPCVAGGVACSWVGPDLCSHCMGAGSMIWGEHRGLIARMNPPAPIDAQLADPDWQESMLEGARLIVARVHYGDSFDPQAPDDDGDDNDQLQLWDARPATPPASCPRCHATTEDEAAAMCCGNDDCPADDLGLFP